MSTLHNNLVSAIFFSQQCLKIHILAPIVTFFLTALIGSNLGRKKCFPFCPTINYKIFPPGTFDLGMRRVPSESFKMVPWGQQRSLTITSRMNTFYRFVSSTMAPLLSTATHLVNPIACLNRLGVGDCYRHSFWLDKRYNSVALVQ